MDKTQLFQFISEQKTAFIASVNGQGYPVIRAMLAPRKIEGNEIYFSTNTSSNKIKQYLANNKACVYFYKRGRFKYQGVSTSIFTNAEDSSIRAYRLRAKCKFVPTKRPKTKSGVLATSCFTNKA